MKGSVSIGILGLVILGIIVVSASAYRVQEYEQVLITQFGKPVGEPIREAGLRWKSPFVQKIHRFEKRLLEHDGDADQITTREKKNIFVDTFARWRIVDPLLFFQSVRDERGAKEKLNDILDSETRDTISRHYLIEAVRNSNRAFLQDAEAIAASSTLRNLAVASPEGNQPETEGTATPALPAGPDTIELGREALTREILDNAAVKIKEYGIELVDVQIKAINYVRDVQTAVFNRMVSERQQIAEKYRAEGLKELADRQGSIKKEQNRILSEAYREAETRKGEAEAEAARIYAEAYGQDPEFYRFWRTLEIYREHLAANVSLVISTDSDIFRFLRNAGAVGSSN